MERLTKPAVNKTGSKYVSAIGSGYGAWPRIIQRLAAYENTGLEPEEIQREKGCENKVATNADRIRAMTDEELAFAIICPRDMGADIATCALTCMECCLQWLHQPAKEE